MKLYFNGCSHTYGDDLKNPQLSAWPSLVASRRNCEFFNDSVSGGTNDRIMYRTIKYIDQFDEFFIAWTYTSRFTRYRADNNHEVNFNPLLVNSLYGKLPEFQDYGLIHYSTWHNELFAFKHWLQNIILLQTLLSSNGKKYTMLNAANNFVRQWSTEWPDFIKNIKPLVCFNLMNDAQLRQEYDEIQVLLKKIDRTNFILFGDWCIMDLCKTHQTGKTGHLIEDGHSTIADTILNHQHSVLKA